MTDEYQIVFTRSARRGDYRVVYRIVETQLVIHIVSVAHRRDVYHRS